MRFAHWLFFRAPLRRQRVGVKGPGRVSAIHRVALSCPMVIAHAPGFSLISRKKIRPLLSHTLEDVTFFCLFFVFCNPSASLYREGGIGEEVETQLIQSPKVQWFPQPRKKAALTIVSPRIFFRDKRGRGRGRFESIFGSAAGDHKSTLGNGRGERKKERKRD